jgi:hypothetical protein
MHVHAGRRCLRCQRLPQQLGMRSMHAAFRARGHTSAPLSRLRSSVVVSESIALLAVVLCELRRIPRGGAGACTSGTSITWVDVHASLNGANSKPWNARTPGDNSLLCMQAALDHEWLAW